MSGPISMDLRERAMARLDRGETVRQVAAALLVAPSSVVKWNQRRRRTGSVAAGKMGGHVPPNIRGEHAAWLRERIAAGPFTLRGLVAELAARGLVVNYPHDVEVRARRAAQLQKKTAAGGRAGAA